MIPAARQEAISSLQADPGWHYDDPVVIEKLAAGLRRHGQLSGLVVRTDLDGARRVVDGRKRLQAMRLLGWAEAWTVDVGTLDDEAAGRMALDLELRAEVDYARLAVAVAWLVDDKGAAPESLASAAPFTADRIAQLRGLASFDWGQFAKAADDGQGGFLFGAEEDPAHPAATDTITPDQAREQFMAGPLAEALDAASERLAEDLNLPPELSVEFETEPILPERPPDPVPSGEPAAQLGLF
ncbi:MAG: ParB N-terminal domain-containing protein [Pseudomonadota bacterium]